MKPGVSQVAFYGDQSLSSDLLATAVYQGFVPYRTQDGREIRDNNALYSKGRPKTICGFLQLSHFALASSPDVGSLGGSLVDGKLLTRESVEAMPSSSGPFERQWPSPFANDKSSIYFVRRDRPGGLNPAERAKLWRSKCTELQMKCAQLADLWHDLEQDYEELAANNDALSRRVQELEAETTDSKALLAGIRESGSHQLSSQLGEFRLHRDTILSNCKSSADLLHWWPVFFPQIDRAKEFDGMVRGLSSDRFSPLVNRLIQLDDFCREWAADSKPTTVAFKARPESEATLNKYAEERCFTCPHLGRQVFSLHGNLPPEGFRLHWLENPDLKRITVGYYGKHLRTVKFSG